MKLVIGIDEEEYKRIKDYCKGIFYGVLPAHYQLINNGTPLKDVCSKCWLNTKEGDSDADGD